MAQSDGSAQGWDAVKRQLRLTSSLASNGLSPLAFDFYFKSRTADELKERFAELKRRRSGTLTVVTCQEEQQHDAVMAAGEDSTSQSLDDGHDSEAHEEYQLRLGQ